MKYLLQLECMGRLLALPRSIRQGWKCQWQTEWQCCINYNSAKLYSASPRCTINYSGHLVPNFLTETSAEKKIKQKNCFLCHWFRDKVSWSVCVLHLATSLISLALILMCSTYVSSCITLNFWLGWSICLWKTLWLILPFSQWRRKMILTLAQGAFTVKLFTAVNYSI